MRFGILKLILNRFRIMGSRVIIASMLLVLMTGCYVPQYLPKVNEYHLSPYGGYITLTEESRHKVKGEMIALENDTLIVLCNHEDYVGIQRVGVNQVKRFKLQLHEPQFKWGMIPAFSLSVVAHGLVAMGSIPVNLLASTIIYRNSVFQGSHLNYDLQDLKSLCRFPQGVPPNVDVDQMQPEY